MKSEKRERSLDRGRRCESALVVRHFTARLATDENALKPQIPPGLVRHCRLCAAGCPGSQLRRTINDTIALQIIATRPSPDLSHDTTDPRYRPDHVQRGVASRTVSLGGVVRR